jgi:hypothetical protein
MQATIPAGFEAALKAVEAHPVEMADADTDAWFNAEHGPAA